jgi:hypothetical protein
MGLGMGVLLLLCSIQMFVNIQDLIGGGDAVRKNGYDYISITKNVTNESMGRPELNAFSRQEMQEISRQPFVDSLAPLIANDFRVQLSAGAVISFKTDLFLETLEEEFIDTVPPTFRWEEGQSNIPVIIASDFLEVYNVFAPSEGLPQISPETASGVPVLITCSGNGLEQTYSARIVAFSDRVNSVLVPKSFLDWANEKFGKGVPESASRLFIKTRDANDPNVLTYLDSKNYRVNKDRTKFGRAKQTLQGIFSGLGVFGVMVVVMALMLFSFYLQLVIARSRDSLQLLLTLGYSPKWLSNNVSKQFIPVYFFVVLGALAITQLIQWLFHKGVMYGREELNTPVHWSVAATAVFLIALSIYTNYSLVRKLVNRLY